MTRHSMRQEYEPALEPVDKTVDHVRGAAAGRLIVEYGDYECPYSRQAFRAIERVETELGEGMRFAFRHFPADRDPPVRPGRGHCHRGRPSKTGSGTCTSRSSATRRHSPMTTCGGMLPTLGSTSHGSAATGAANAARGCVRRDVESGMASGEVRGTPTLFIDGAVHRGAYDDAATLLEALAR
jgi:hypothetical protein